MKCIICEQELEDVDPDSIAQPYGGGEVKVSFCYGSRKFDSMGLREGCFVDGHEEYVTGKLNGKPIRFPQHNWSKPLSDEELQERSEHKGMDLRTVRLSACNRILGVICDECFEKKAHLFQGYEKDGPNEKPRLVVE